MILAFSFFGVFTLHEDEESSSLLLKTAIASPSRAMLLVNNFIANSVKGNFKDLGHKNTPVKKNSKNKFSETLFFILNSMLTGSESELFLVILFMTFFGFEVYRKLAKSMSSGPPGKLPDMREYLKWCIKFMTPLERCVQSIAQKYSANPLSYGIVGETARVLILRIKNAGFFYGVTQWT